MFTVNYYNRADLVFSHNCATRADAFAYVGANAAGELVEVLEDGRLVAVAARNFWLDDDDLKDYIEISEFHATLNVGRFVSVDFGQWTVDQSGARTLKEWREEMETHKAWWRGVELQRVYAIARREGMTGANAAWLAKAMTVAYSGRRHLEHKAREAARTLRNLPNLHKQPLGKGAHFLTCQNDGIRKIIFDK